MSKKELAVAKQELAENSMTALTDNTELTAMLREDAKENLANVADAYHRISIQGSRFKVDGKVIGQDGVKFQAIILKEIPVNIFFATKYDPSNPTPPDCWSVGGLKPDVSVAEKQSSSCLTCPQNRFGSGTDQEGHPGKGKACGNSRRLVLKIEGVDLPVLMSMPPTGIRSFNQYLKELSSLSSPLPVFAVVTEFSFDTTVDWALPVAKMVGMVTPEQYKELKQYRESDVVKSALMAFASSVDTLQEADPWCEDEVN